ncbi:hypothetical protein F511_46336 [Dorcoceras hygrometricum]|uniref:Uncharacterized protein n=1 Tax=Dorcoceras hygrometricum TaxID=472368 RepID=A0A2Z6ZUW6_9LAMI|nr:hypothetical protein F511_46336 [Dorcoceras hygrometricum]
MPEPNPRRIQTSLHDFAGDSPERRPAGGRRHEKSRRHKGARPRASSCNRWRNAARHSRAIMRRPASRVARNQQRRPASTALHLRTIMADFHRDMAPSARWRRATIAQVSAVIHTLMRAAARDVAQQFARGGIFMAGRHARPARMASRALWRARWAAARGGGRSMIFQRF